MIRILIISLFFVLWGCSLTPQCPEGSRIITKGEFPTLTTPDTLQWSVVSYKDFDNYCWKNKIGYVGSYEDYHLLEWWSKVLPIVGAEFKFAVLKTDWSPPEEYQYKLNNSINSIDSTTIN